MDIRHEVYDALTEVMFQTGATKDDLDVALQFFWKKFWGEEDDETC